MHNIFKTILSFVLFLSITSPYCLAGEVELFIPSEKAEEFLQKEKTSQRIEYQKKFDSFKKNVTLPAVHENTITYKEDIISDGGAVIIDENSDLLTTKADKVNFIHENKFETNEPIIAEGTSSKNIKIHENSIEFTNYIVHENSINNKYSSEIMTAEVPDSNTVWSAASSQATLLFSKSAEKRDKATRNIINNGNWLQVAEKLLASDDEIIRINGINLLKAAVNNPKYRHIPVSVKINKLSPLLISSLTDSNTKVRFLAALILNKLTGTNFNYKFNSDPTTQTNAITAWNNYIKSVYGS